MRFIATLIILALSLVLVGCSKEENKPAPEQSSSTMSKSAEKSKVMQQTEQAVQEAKEKVAKVTEQAKEQVAQVKEQAQEKVATASDQAKDQMAKMEQKVQEAVPMGSSDLAAGKDIYDKNCSVCHKLGVAGAPKTGDKAAWAPHIASGVDHLTERAITGVGAMPPKGGNAKLTDAEVRAAVEYIVEQSR